MPYFNFQINTQIFPFSVNADKFIAHFLTVFHREQNNVKRHTDDDIEDAL